MALATLIVAFAVYNVLKNLNVENPSMIAAATGLAVPVSAIALLFFEYLQFLTGYFAILGQVP